MWSLAMKTLRRMNVRSVGPKDTRSCFLSGGTFMEQTLFIVRIVFVNSADRLMR